MQYNTTIDFDLKFIDLFCGIGGFHVALSRNGCECVFACDIDKKCCDIYEENFNIKPDLDIKKVDEKNIEDFDILCAGFPCQSFSHSGKQKGFLDETRGTLFFDICRILKHKQPSYFILENVKNLYGHDKGKTWKTIYNSLTELGYLTYEKPIMASPLHFGIPQNRDRLFIIGIHTKLNKKLPIYPVYKKQITNIIDILEDDDKITDAILEKVKLSDKQISVLNIWEKFIQFFKENKIKLPTFPIWIEEFKSLGEPVSDLPVWKQKIINSNRDFYKKHKIFLKDWLKLTTNFTGSSSKLEWQCGEFTPSDSMWTLLFQYRPSGIRVKRSSHSNALVAMAQIVYIGSKKRKLTPRETASLQSFPDNFIIHSNNNQAYKQFGNSVNVKVIENILYHLLN